MASRIWKLLFLHESSLLFELVETIFNNFAFPKSWKFATIVPLPKVSNIIGPEDLRPISLLPLQDKIVEHLLCTQIDNYLELNGLLTDIQNGFRTKCSTTQTIFDYTMNLIKI